MANTTKHAFLSPAIAVVLAIAAATAAAGADSTPLGVESSGQGITAASTPAANAVSIELARNIALSEARRTWGPGVLRDPIIAYDFDGGVSAYIFMYKKGAGVFPTDDKVFKEMSDADAGVDVARRAVAEAREEAFNAGQVKVIEEAGKATTVKPEKWAHAEATLRDLEDRKGGVGTYGTLVVSATKDLAPILKGINGLHSYFTRRTLTEGAAERELGRHPERISKVIFSPPENEMFEYEANGSKVTISASSAKRVEMSGMVRRAGAEHLSPEAAQARQAEKDWVAAKWREVESSAGGK